MISAAESALDLFRDWLLQVPCSDETVNPDFCQSVVGEQCLAYLIFKPCCVTVPYELPCTAAPTCGQSIPTRSNSLPCNHSSAGKQLVKGDDLVPGPRRLYACSTSARASHAPGHIALKYETAIAAGRLALNCIRFAWNFVRTHIEISKNGCCCQGAEEHEARDAPLHVGMW